MSFRMTSKILVASLAIVLMVSGCTKAYDPSLPDDPNSNNSQQKLSKITYDDGSYLTVQYNSAGHPMTIKTLEKGVPNDEIRTYQLSYNGDKLLEMNADDGSKYKYTYTGSDITKVEIIMPGNTLLATYEYTYKDGRLWRTDLFDSFTGSVGTGPTMRFEVDYYTNGNIKTMKSWFKDLNTGSLEQTSVYEMTAYDSKRNTSLVFENNPYLPTLVGMPNNPLSEKHFDKSGQQIATVTHTYTYDSKGNPLTRRTVTASTGLPDEIVEVSFQY